MVVEKKLPAFQNESGQTLIEVTFLLPVLLIFVVILYKIMMAAQMAIVNTQYARSQVYKLTMNQPEYPRLEFRLNPTMFKTMGEDRMVLGVSDPKAVLGDGELEPLPQQQKIGRAGSTMNGSEERGEVKLRTNVRVRNTSAICTQLNDVPNGSNNRWPFSTEVCRYKGMK